MRISIRSRPGGAAVVDSAMLNEVELPGAQVRTPVGSFPASYSADAHRRSAPHVEPADATQTNDGAAERTALL
jgi:hypothetical protein